MLKNRIGLIGKVGTTIDSVYLSCSIENLVTSIFQLAIIFIGGIQGIETRFTYTCLGVYIEAGVDVYNTKYDSFV